MTQRSLGPRAHQRHVNDDHVSHGYHTGDATNSRRPQMFQFATSESITPEDTQALVVALSNNSEALELLRLFAEQQIVNRALISRRIPSITESDVHTRIGHVTRAVRSITNEDDGWYCWLPDTNQWCIGVNLRDALRRQFGMRVTD